MVAIGMEQLLESEQFVADIIKELPEEVFYIIVNERGKCLLSFDIAKRNFRISMYKREVLSIARRLQDP
jgi:uncharacterized protein